MNRSDEDLVIAYREGDGDAFTQLVKRLGPGLLGYLRKMLGSDTEAEDLFQDTFRKVLDKLEGFDANRKFKPWLYRIAYNAAIDHIRKRQRGIDGKSISTDNEDVSAMTMIRSNDPSPVEVMDKTERKVLVRTAVESLPPRQKTTLVLAYFHGMTYPQVVDAMECSVGTVKTQMSRALRTLAGKLPSTSLESLGVGGQQ